MLKIDMPTTSLRCAFGGTELVTTIRISEMDEVKIMRGIPSITQQFNRHPPSR
jgi:hypothetical protein